MRRFETSEVIFISVAVWILAIFGGALVARIGVP